MTKNSAPPAVALSTARIASSIESPFGSRPSVSTVKPMTIGIPAAVAARVIPIASSG